VDALWPYLTAIIPTIVVATIFYFLMKGMIEGDRRERLAQRQFEAEQDRRRAAERQPPAEGTNGQEPPENGAPNS
jgi:hypothetical protein